MIYIFDVDGTLTPSRQTINEKFEVWFKNWMRDVQLRGDLIMLVTGSDRIKTIEQLGEDIVNQMDYCCNCMGNTVYRKSDLVYDFKLNAPKELINFLNQCLLESEYPHRFGNHIEDRGSMINFSVVGRNAVGNQRTHYYDWDQCYGERIKIAKAICEKFSKYDIIATVGGETGLDIAAAGKDKSQVMQYIDQPAVFMGDRIDPAGNDWSLAQALCKDSRFTHRVMPVDNWMQTWQMLRSIN